MQEVFVQTGDSIWVQVSSIKYIKWMISAYVLVLDTDEHLTVQAEYNDNITRLLRSSHFGKLEL